MDDETVSIEFDKCTGGVDKSLLETLVHLDADSWDRFGRYIDTLIATWDAASDIREGDADETNH